MISENQDSWMVFLKYRFVGMALCGGLWTVTFMIRIFLGSVLPPILMFPFMAIIALSLSYKFLSFVCNQNDYGVTVMITIGLMSFIVLLTGSLPLLMMSAVIALLGWTQFLVKFSYNYRQYSKPIAIGLFMFVFLSILAAVVCYVSSGATLPVMIAMFAVNLFSVCFYFLNHPTIFEHYKEILSFITISMDFFAMSILMHTIYVPLCILAPNLFSIAFMTGVTYMFHAVSLALMTIFVSRPNKNYQESQSTKSVSKEDVDGPSVATEDFPPVGMIVQTATAIPSAPPMATIFGQVASSVEKALFPPIAKAENVEGP